MTARGELYDLLHRGAWVTVRNPWVSSEWSGRLIAMHDDPGIVIEQADGVRICLPQEFAVTEEPAPPARPAPGAAALRQLAAALRQLAADLEAEARSISGQDEPPWAAMYGLKVTSGAEAAVILRRAAQLALQRAEAPQNVPGRVLASRAPQPAGPAGDHHDSTEERHP